MQIKLVALVIFSMALVGCASSTSVYVLDQEELIAVKAGQTVTPKFDGWLLSNRAVNRVMNAKIKDINLK
jgi:uncharacterized protein YcfL